MSKWIHTTLNDICRSDKGAIISGPFGSNISSKFFVLDGVPVIRGNNLSLSLDKFYDDDFVFVTEEKADELNCYAEEGDLIFTAAGTIGQVGILEAPLKYKKYVISNKQLRARIDTRKVDLLYAYYWFASAWMQNYFIRNNKGSTVPLITLSELKDAPISYPEDITEQKKIAMAIEAISRKINNNRNICFNLESMAKTLYDYWFTQFDFPNAEGKPYRSSGGEMVWNDQLKREIPKGWDTATINEMTKSSLFEEANLAFLQGEHSLFRTEVAERTLCGVLMLHIHDIIKEDDSYSGYYTDVEYNRNAGGIKTIRKTIRGQQEEIIPINCDLILHSRGENVDQDNLIAIEMKKSNAPSAEKQKDRERLIALTKDSFDDVWAWDHNLPEHVCRYVLGVYYEINYRQKEIHIEYYRRGELVRSYSNHFVG